MHVTKTAVINGTTHIHFDVDSSAIAKLHIMDVTFDFNGSRQLSVSIHYKSNPEITYMYNFKGIEDIANLYLELLGQDSAGKFATYVRNNADTVAKLTPNPDAEYGRDCEMLTARKAMA